MVKCYRIMYRIKGYLDIDAEDAQTALDEFDSLEVKRLLEKSSFENINVIEL